MRLAALQKVLWKLITEPDGSVEKLAPKIVNSTPMLPAAKRVAIYADMYFWRNVGALQMDYPKLSAVLGDEAFFALTRRYLKSHKSEHHDLGHAGWRLPEFLKRARAGRKDLADLASLEWARSGAYTAKDASPLTMADMAKVRPERFARLRLAFTPSARLVHCQHDVASVWQAVESGKKKIPPARREQQHLVVWRKGFEVFHSRVDAREAKALTLAMGGKQLGQVLSVWKDPAEAFKAIGSWVGEGMIRAA